VSKRHQANRRKAYGKRQHELHERRQRDRVVDAFDAAYGDDFAAGARADRFAFLDPRSPRLRYATGD
jgi:hypothetical protein